MNKRKEIIEIPTNTILSLCPYLNRLNPEYLKALSHFHLRCPRFRGHIIHAGVPGGVIKPKGPKGQHKYGLEIKRVRRHCAPNACSNIYCR